MWRFSLVTPITAFLSLCLALAASIGITLFAPNPTIGRVATQTTAQTSLQPSATCTYSPMSLTLTGSGNVEDARPFTPTSGETYFQFAPADPLTTTNFSNGAALLNSTLSGSVSGGISGSFSISNLNGMAITASTADPNTRGFEANSLLLADSQGSLTLLITYNFTADTATAPYYPRTINGNVQSTSTTGAYSQLKFAGTIIGAIGAPSGGSVPINASIQGRLYTVPSNSPMNRHSNPSRNLPAIHAFSLSPSDILAQFYRPDIHATGSVGSFTPNSVFSGPLTNGSTIVGTTSIDNAQLVSGTQLDFSPGWAIGNWRMYESQGNAYGPLLADQNGPSPNAYYFQTGGTGSYAGGLMFSPVVVTIGYQGGRDMTADPFGGYYCTDFAPANPTTTPTPPVPSPTPTDIPTAIPTITTTPTAQPALVGHVNWEARPSQPNQLQSLPITLTLKSNTTELNYPTQLTDQYGFFTVTLGSLPTGTYTWRVDDSTSALHSPNYLSNSDTVNLTGAPITTVDMGLMSTGDANNDDLVSIADFSILKGSFGFGCQDTAYDNRADFTGDCVVNVTDFNPLKNNFGHSGAPPIHP